MPQLRPAADPAGSGPPGPAWPRSPRRARHQVALAALAAALASLLLILWLAQPWLQALEERASDWVWAQTASRADERRLIVIDVDERSLAEVGPWPWPRATQAQLLDRLAQAGAGQQILDIVFAEQRPDDAVLAQALRRHDPVLAQVFALEQGGQPAVGRLAGWLPWTACPAPFGEAAGYLGNSASLLPAVPAVPAAQPAAPAGAPAPAPAGPAAGHITPRIAADGVMRHQPAVICHGGRSYPALAIAALLHGAGDDQLQLQRGGWLQAPWLLSPGNGLAAPIPLDERGDLRIAWRQHPDSFISLSAADVLAGHTPPGLLDGAWALIGSSAFGLNDTIATPFGGAASGLQAHAQLITALIDGQLPRTPRVAPLVQALAALAGAALLYALLLGGAPRTAPAEGSAPGPRRGPVYLLPLAGAALAALLWLGHGVLQVVVGWWLGWAAPALFLLLAGVYLGIFEHARSRIDRDRLYTHLSSYLPAPVAAALALQPPSSAIAAQVRQVSVLFADIRNFSAYCEARPPEESAAVLHAFFSTATRIVQAHGGVIEAFQGDAIIAVWNGELQTDPAAAHHAASALQAAIALQAAVQGVLPDPAPAGLEPLSLGLGVETGPATVGSFGLASRRTHMVMGRTVTIASRLVAMTADLAHPILVGEGLAAQVGGAGLQSMGTFLLDGMRVPHHIYAHPLDATAPAPASAAALA